MGHSTGCPPVPLVVGACVCPIVHQSLDLMGSWDIPWDVHLSLSQMRVYPPVHPIPRSHGAMGHSMGCPPAPLTEARVSYCPSNPRISWDHGTFHGMSTCPSCRCMCLSHCSSIPRSHGIVGHFMGCPPVPLTEACVSHCLSHPTVPWDCGTFHGMSTCPSHRCMCVPLSIPSHDPMGPWDIPWGVHLSLSQMRVYPPVHPIPGSHGTMGHSMGCPPVPLTEARVSYCPSHPMGPWDIPWDVHLSLSHKRVYPTVHPIP